MRATIQLCTYNRAHLLGRVLDACFEQTVGDDDYEVVLVNDGSTDSTADVIAAAKTRATCAFTVVDQANSGLAAARNAGIAQSRGKRIIFIDDDVLPMPTFVAEHLRAAEADPGCVVRGGVINTESFDDLPPARWSLRNYSANWFWTTNVSVSRTRLDQVGWFDTSFSEYGWEDIELGMRLRAVGTRAVFNPLALAFHWKPRPRGTNVEAMLRQARAQARTAVLLEQKHPDWRVALAVADTPVQRGLATLAQRTGMTRAFESLLSDVAPDRPLSPLQALAAQVVRGEAYFDELARAKRG